MKPGRLALVIAVTAYCDLACAGGSRGINDRDARAFAVIHQYVATHKHWKESDYRIELDGLEKGKVVYQVIYLPEERDRNRGPGGGESFWAYYDPTSQRIVEVLYGQ
jgi:hypothetical protein